jgi:hypothetical protein
MVNIMETERLIKKVSLFSDLSSKERQNLIAFSEKRKYPNGSIVVYRGDMGDVLCHNCPE